MISAINRIIGLIDKESDLIARACLTAEMAIYVAREGDFERARKIAMAVRAGFDTSVDLRLACWLCLLDGVILFHEKPDADAFDRVRRAYYLSRSIAESKVGVVSSAWLSHLEFNRGNLSECVLLLSEALQHANDSVPGCLSRIALTIADIFSYSGNWEESQKWYIRSRIKAISDGDQIAISAVLHNTVTFRVHSLRLTKFCGMPEPSRGCWAELELNSSRNYDIGIELLSLSSLEPIIRAQLLVLYDRFNEAFQLLEKSIVSLKSDGLNRYRAMLYADQLLCKVNLSIVQNFNESAEFILQELEYVTDHDDRALVFGLLAQASGILGFTHETQRFSRLASEEIAKHRGLVTLLNKYIFEARLDYKNWIYLYERC